MAGGASAGVRAYCLAGVPGDSAVLSAACGDALQPAVSHDRSAGFPGVYCHGSGGAFVRYGVDVSRATLQQAQGASLRLNGTVEQVRRVDSRTTLVVIKLEEIQGRSVRALVNERVRVYRRDGSAKSAAQRPEASSAAKHQGSGTARSQAIYPGMKVTALGTVEFNGSTAKLSGATIFPAPASGAGSNATAQTAAEPYLSTLKEQLRTRALDTLGTESAALVLGTAYGDDSLMSSTAREEYKLSGLSHITAVSGANIAIVFLGAYRLVLAVRPYRFASAYLLFCSWMQRLRGESRLVLDAPRIPVAPPSPNTLASLNNLPRQTPTPCRRSCTG